MNNEKIKDVEIYLTEENNGYILYSNINNSTISANMQFFDNISDISSYLEKNMKGLDSILVEIIKYLNCYKNKPENFIVNNFNYFVKTLLIENNLSK